MAEKNSFDKIVNIPLRKSWLLKARNKRTKRAIYEIKKYTLKHTKADDVKVSKMVNELLWEHGIQRPPNSLKVKIVVSGGVAKVMLPDEKEEIKAEEKKGAAAALKDRITGKPSKPAPAKSEPAKVEPAKETSSAAPKEEKT
jgi:large subunit ribosomal protein L31e